MSEPRLKFALIGTGNFGPWFAGYLNEVGVLTAICDPSAEARAGFFEITKLDVPAYGDYEQLLAEADIDAVAITGPNFVHKPITLAAAAAGKHVFCEKAMAPTVADCWEMVRACEAANVRLMVGHKRRLRRPWARLVELKEQIGTPVSISMTGYWDARPENFRGWWTREEQSGGVLMLSGVHEIDWMRALGGDVTAVSAISGPQIDERYDFPDSIQVLLRYASGATGSIGVSLSHPLHTYHEVTGAEVVASNGGMRLVSGRQEADVYWQRRDENEGHHEHFDEPTPDPIGAHDAFRKELGDFVHWVQEDATPCLTWREGLRCVEVIEAARLSAKQDGRWMQLPLYPELEQQRNEAAKIERKMSSAC